MTRNLFVYNKQGHEMDKLIEQYCNIGEWRVFAFGASGAGGMQRFWAVFELA